MDVFAALLDEGDELVHRESDDQILRKLAQGAWQLHIRFDGDCPSVQEGVHVRHGMVHHVETVADFGRFPQEFRTHKGEAVGLV